MTLPDAPDVAKLLIGWLPPALAGRGWPDITAADVLADRGESVAVYRVGGPMRDLVTDSPTIAVDAKGRTKERSGAILGSVRTLVHALAGTDDAGATVQRVQEFSGPAHLPSADSPTRYTMTLSLDVSIV